MELRIRFGAHVRRLRVSRELTQQVLATRSALSVETIRRIEAGALSPSLDTLDRLCGGLEVSLQGLFEGMSERGTPYELDLRQRIERLRPTQAQTVLKVVRALFSGG